MISSDVPSPLKMQGLEELLTKEYVHLLLHCYFIIYITYNKFAIIFIILWIKVRRII